MPIMLERQTFYYTSELSELECRQAHCVCEADRHKSDATVLAEIFAPVNYEDFMAVFIVTDFFPADLSQIIRSPQQLTDVHVQVRLSVSRCV